MGFNVIDPVVRWLLFNSALSSLLLSAVLGLALLMYESFIGSCLMSL